MDIETWKAMLERRGYSVKVWQEGTHIEYTISGVAKVSRPASQFRQMTYKGARKKIDDELGQRMQHSVHVCGYPVLRAPMGYTNYEPFYSIEEPLPKVTYYPIPLDISSKPLEVCPQCGKPLDAKSVRRVKDPEIAE